jgi:opacity protein-like surface antigen
MKKFCAVLVVGMLLCSTVFAVDFSLSAGVGGLFTAGWKDAELKSEYKDYTLSLLTYLGQVAAGDPTAQPIASDYPTLGAINKGYFDTKETSVGGGIWAFFDATYAELDAALIWNSITQDVKTSSINPAAGNTEKDYLITQLNISILGKYPFAIGEKLQLFPLLGVDFQIALTDRDDEIAKDIKSAPGNTTAPSLGDFWNSLWLKAGIGVDYSITENLYLRCEALYGIKFNSKYETDQADYWAENFKGVKNGPDVRLGVGYRFKTFGK